MKCYHHPELVETAQQSSRTGVFIELLEMFKASVFRNSDRVEWRGSASQLLSDMLNDETTKHVANNYRSDQIGRLLGKLEAQGYPGLRRSGHHGSIRTWIISATKEDQDVDCPF